MSLVWRTGLSHHYEAYGGDGQAPHFTEIAADLGVSMEERATGASCIDRDSLGGWLYRDGSSCLNGTFHNLQISIESPSMSTEMVCQCAFESRQSAGFSQVKQSI